MSGDEIKAGIKTDIWVNSDSYKDRWDLQEKVDELTNVTSDLYLFELINVCITDKMVHVVFKRTYYQEQILPDQCKHCGGDLNPSCTEKQNCLNIPRK